MTLPKDIAAAKWQYAPKADWIAIRIGRFERVVTQRSFGFAQSENDVMIARESFTRRWRYLDLLFNLLSK